MKSNRPSAFTLIELLVVVAIIALLAALLLPALGRVKGKAQQTVCLGKLKQWGVAMIMYADDNDGVLPREDAMDDVNPWSVAMAPANRDVWYNCVAEAMPTTPVSEYAKNPLNEVFYSGSSPFLCPTAKFPAKPATYPIFSLAMNSQLMGLNERVTTEMIDEPSQTALFLDCGVPGEPLTHPMQRPFNGQPKVYANRFSGRHNNGGNIVMAQGNAGRFAASQVINPKSGRSFYPPTVVIWSTRRDIQP
jgi:prepilin-type N-terminal cleavage/methylation domain-containing protein